MPKTRIVSQTLSSYDETSRILIVTQYKQCENFKIAFQNIKRVLAVTCDVILLQLCKTDQRINIVKLLYYDRVFITLEGLRQLT